MTSYPTLAEAQAHEGVVLCNFNASTGMWEAYVDGDQLPVVPASGDWKPQAQADLGVWKVKVNGILSQMLTIYSAKGQTANIAAVVAAMESVASIQNSALIVAALSAEPGSRAAFDTAIQQRWLQIVVGPPEAPTPAQVKADFPNYAAGTL